MFENVFDFGFNRTNKQAFGFWLVWLVIGMLGSGFITFLLPSSASGWEEGFQEGVAIGSIVVIFYCPLIAFLVLAAKNRFNDFSSIVITLLSIIIASFLGAIFGLIPAAYLTTLAKK